MLVRHAKKHGIELRQSYTRLAKAAAVRAGRYAHARQFRRMRRELKRLRTFLGRVLRDIGRKIACKVELERTFARLFGLVERLLAQKPKDKNKLYSLHAPEVVCISKGKARTPYEFGCKVGIAATNREGLVLRPMRSKTIPMTGTPSHAPSIRLLPWVVSIRIASTSIKAIAVMITPGRRRSTSSMTGATLPRASVRMSVWRSYVFAHATEM